MNDSILIREYKKSDKKTLLNILKLNTPKYFSPTEKNDFINYLEFERELYYVLILNEKIVGCGGVNFAENKTIGKISWDILHPEHQGKSLGTQLLNYRIERLKAFENVKKITVRTSQMAYKFYEKQGFGLDKVKKDYWAKGFDLYKMTYKLSVNA